MGQQSRPAPPIFGRHALVLGAVTCTQRPGPYCDLRASGSPGARPRPRPRPKMSPTQLSISALRLHHAAEGRIRNPVLARPSGFRRSLIGPVGVEIHDPTALRHVHLLLLQPAAGGSPRGVHQGSPPIVGFFAAGRVRRNVKEAGVCLERQSPSPGRAASTCRASTSR